MALNLQVKNLPAAPSGPAVSAALRADSQAIETEVNNLDIVVSGLTANVTTSWVSGTVYASGDFRRSPVNFQTYRRLTNGAGTTDPSADPTNWVAATAGSNAQPYTVGPAVAADQAVQAQQIQSQSVTAFTTGGTSTAYTLTPVPVLSALAAGQRFRIKFNATAGATPTLAISGLATHALMYYDATGAKVACGASSIVANMLSDVEFDGTDYVLLDPLGITQAAADVRYMSAILPGGIKNFSASALGINNYNCVITADKAILENGSGLYYGVEAVNLTVNANGTVGAPLSIMSARAASTWYYRWLWYNATSGLTATLDASATAPTAPTGYAATDYKTLLPGACRTDASGGTYLLQIMTKGKKSQYVPLAGSNLGAYPQIASGTAAALTAASVASVAPATAIEVRGNMLSSVQNAMIRIAANSVVELSSYTNGASSVAFGTFQFSTMLESSNIYWMAPGGGADVRITGWEDNI